MVGTQFSFSYPKRPLTQRLRLPVAVLIPVEARKAIEDCSGVAMLQTKKLLVDCQRPLEERLGFLVAFLTQVEARKAVEASSSAGMLRA